MGVRRLLELHRLLDRSRVLEERHGHGHELGAQRAELGESRLDRVGDLRVGTVDQTGDDADSKTPDSLVEELAVRDIGGLHARRIAAIVPGDGGEEERAVHRRPGDRSGRVEARRHRHDAPVRDEAGRGAEPRDAAVGGRDPDRAGGVGADAPGNQVCRDRRPVSAARAAADPLRRPRVVSGAEMWARGEGAVGELMQVQLAEDDRSRLSQPRDDVCVPHRHVVGEDPRGRGRGRAGDVDHVLQRDRNAPERAALVRAFQRVRFGQGLVRSHGDVGSSAHRRSPRCDGDSARRPHEARALPRGAPRPAARGSLVGRRPRHELLELLERRQEDVEERAHRLEVLVRRGHALPLGDLPELGRRGCRGHRKTLTQSEVRLWPCRSTCTAAMRARRNSRSSYELRTSPRPAPSAARKMSFGCFRASAPGGSRAS